MSRADTRLTIVDIRRLTGVSKSTVPRVLSGVGGVVASSGYRRNDLARSLRSGRTGMLGLLGANLYCFGDVVILGFDGIPAGNFPAPRLSTVVKPAREIGACAFALLAACIEVREAVRHLTLPTSICERESLPNSCSYARLRAV